MRRRYQHYLVTGGAGFMGSDFIQLLLSLPETKQVICFDLLTYAGSLKNVEECASDSRFQFIQGDICELSRLESVFKQYTVDCIVHFAAETHVDRSIDDPLCFAKTNVIGTVNLLECMRRFKLSHFHHISTDEVYGSLGNDGFFTEESCYHPNSPYSASKAASDHFVLAYGHTFQIPVTVSHASNNYGPKQYPEKLIPKLISCLVKNEAFPVYGTGNNYREWTYVEDHSRAVLSIIEKGDVQATYNIGSGNERTNLEIIDLVISELALQLKRDIEGLKSLITFVEDRKGHDFRYAIDASKLKASIGFSPQIDLKEGIKKTVQFYLMEMESIV